MLIISAIFYCLGLAAALPGADRDRDGKDGHVKSGGSIQRAIDCARPYSTITIDQGIYYEHLTITKPGLTLIGNGAMIRAPKSPSNSFRNDCTGLAGNGTQAGVCVAGRGIVYADFKQEHRKVLSVGDYVCDVKIRGLDVSGFDLDVVFVGAKDGLLASSKLNDGANYGFLSAGSLGTITKDNVVTSSGPAYNFGIGLCNDNFAQGGTTQVDGNSVSGYITGLCIQTSWARIHRNKVQGNCLEAYVDPFVEGVEIEDNYIGPVAAACGFGGVGITLDGAKNTVVRGNQIEGQYDGTPGPHQNGGAGVFVEDDACDASNPSPTCLSGDGSLAKATGNVISGNQFANNNIDIFQNATVTGNSISGNKCSAYPGDCK